MSYCPECGAEFVEEASFCSLCGCALPKNAAPPPVPAAPAADCPAFKKSIVAAALIAVGLFMLNIIGGAALIGLYASELSILFIVTALIGMPCSIVGLILGFKAGNVGRAGRGKQRKAAATRILGVVSGSVGIVFTVTYFILFFVGLGIMPA
ncbi:MAG: zinc ribbon domain-containing protein [Clostridiales bacterium]|jgi:hypothetical protein|nr:zinc ribbon domain-containing protein [Clostridiales bacterium]